MLQKQQQEPIKDNRTNRDDSDDVVSVSSGVTRSIKSLPPTPGTSEGSLKSSPTTSGAALQCSQSASAGAEVTGKFFSQEEKYNIIHAAL